ncbi:translationally-controlled tumor protein-like [Ursus americanus]|uniref:translationally-controlled tumor protein-like n=1 Tax=Ursus americanus TaxID=9643 RepID=UPI001E67A583|nr:translationally-controlled tumor protein-like [Ursus americanus]
MLSGNYKIWELAFRHAWGWRGKLVSRTEGNTDDSFIGGNASAEVPEVESTENTVITGADIVTNHHLPKPAPQKKPTRTTSKMQSIKDKFEEQRPERVKRSKTGTAERIKHNVANFENYQFFTGENINLDGMVALLDYFEDGLSHPHTPYMIFFKDGLAMEK